MTGDVKLNKPWLIAVWPGMGHVAMSAGYYLMAKLEMHLLAEFSPSELFDVEHVEVKNGLVHTGSLPRSRMFAWTDPNQQHDLVVFIGEAQPPTGKYAFCRGLIDHAKQLGVERVFTFAAMATDMHPEHESRVFCAAADEQSLHELRELKLEILEDGRIGGLNGVLLGVAAENGMSGACLLGEIPHVFAQFPFPKASLAVLDVFTSIAGIEIDKSELAEQARNMEQQLGELFDQVKRSIEQQKGEFEEEEFVPEPEEERLSPMDERHIEQLFKAAKQDRSKAYELKRELDRLEVFDEYEDRFLDLFKESE